MDKYVVTVNREFGSLGRPIAKKLSEILDIEYYDRDIVEMAAKKLGLPNSEVDEKEESAERKTPFRFYRMQYPLGKNTSSEQDKIFEEQSKLIRLFASEKSCVIVGRCSDFTLAEMDNTLHIYIYAPFRERVKNSVESLGIPSDEAGKLVYEVDQARNAYYMTYAGYMPDDKSHKDLMIDSSVLGVDGTAEFLADFVRRKMNL